MSFRVKKLYIFIGLVGVILLLSIWPYLAVIFRVTVTPEKANTKFEYGRYSSWNWTPDGRVIYVKSIEQMEQTKGMGTMGYRNLGTVTQVRVINPDGSGDKLIKEVFYQSVRQKLVRRYHELKEQHNGRMLPEYYDQANKESSNGNLNMRYLDAPLAHIGWIDWNGKNNKLVFVANDGKGKMGIAISDPEFKEVKWIYYIKGPYFDYAHPQWSYDGNKIAFIDEGLWLTDISTEQTEKIFKDQDIRYFSWHPNGNRMVIEAGPKKCGVIDLEGSYIDKWEKFLNIGDPSISPNGHRIVYFSGDTSIMDIDGNNKRTLYPYGGSFRPKWSPDGKKILMGWEGQIEVINPDGSGYFEITKGLQGK